MTLPRFITVLGLGAAFGACLALPIAAMVAPVPTLPVCPQGRVL